MVDGANPSVIKSLKRYYGNSEFIQYELIKPEIVECWIYADCEENKVCPVNFRSKHKELLQRAHRILSKRRIKIDPRFSKLTALRPVKEIGTWPCSVKVSASV